MIKKPVKDLVHWINTNPNNHGASVPWRKRQRLREAESAGLIAYGVSGWQVTTSGEKVLLAVC